MWKLPRSLATGCSVPLLFRLHRNSVSTVWRYFGNQCLVDPERYGHDVQCRTGEPAQQEEEVPWPSTLDDRRRLSLAS